LKKIGKSCRLQSVLRKLLVEFKLIKPLLLGPRWLHSLQQVPLCYRQTWLSQSTM